MPLTAKKTVIGDTATLIHKAISNGCRVHIYSGSGGHDVTLGPVTVTDTNGLIVPSSKTSELLIELPPGDSLYGICASGQSHTLHFLIVEF